MNEIIKELKEANEELNALKELRSMGLQYNSDDLINIRSLEEKINNLIQSL